MRRASPEYWTALSRVGHGLAECLRIAPEPGKGLLHPARHLEALVAHPMPHGRHQVIDELTQVHGLRAELLAALVDACQVQHSRPDGRPLLLSLS